MTKKSPCLPLLFGLCLTLALCTAHPTRGETETPAPPNPAVHETVLPAAAGASRIYIDPQTGEIDTPPPADVPDGQVLVLTPDLQNASSTSSEGLVVQPNTGPAGGIMVDLQGRFQNVTTVTIGSDGKPVFQSVTSGSQLLANPR